MIDRSIDTQKQKHAEAGQAETQKKAKRIDEAREREARNAIADLI